MCYRLNGYHVGFCIWISWKKLKFILQFVAKEWKGLVQGTVFSPMSCGIYSPFKNLWYIYIYISRSIFNDNHHLLSDHGFYVKVTSKLTPIIWYWLWIHRKSQIGSRKLPYCSSSVASHFEGYVLAFLEDEILDLKVVMLSFYVS